MRDGLGGVDSVLVLGGTSDIGLAIVGSLRIKKRIILAGRPSDRLTRSAEVLRSEMGVEVTVQTWDARNPSAATASLAGAFAAGDVDVVILAAGVLGDVDDQESDPDAAVAMADVTYVGSLHALLFAAGQLRQQGHGSLVVLSSVAAIRPRSANYIYGSAKAGLDFAARGLMERLRGTGVELILVRPGFVRTTMTTGLPEAPFTVDAHDVARTVASHLGRGSRIAYAPPLLQPVMGVIRHLPSAVYRRLPGG